MYIYVYVYQSPRLNGKCYLSSHWIEGCFWEIFSNVTELIEIQRIGMRSEARLNLKKYDGTIKSQQITKLNMLSCKGELCNITE